MKRGGSARRNRSNPAAPREWAGLCMKTLSLSSMTVGARYEQSIFLPAGQKLIPPDTPIERRHLEMLRKHGYATVFLADSSDEVHSAAGRGKGCLAGAGLIETHASSGDGESAAGAELFKQRVKLANALKEQVLELSRRMERTVRPDEHEIWDGRRGAAAAWPDPEQLAADRRVMVDRLMAIHRRIDAGEAVAFSELSVIVDALYPLLLNHRVRFTQLALLVARRDDYLADHALCAAVLGMATAAQLTWPPSQIRLVGLAALVSDLGMLMVPRRIRVGGEQLSQVDRRRVHKHPGYTLAMLAKVRDVPDAVRVAAYQHHERENGSGYPHGLRGADLHDGARVLAVADVLAALMSPRHYRRDQLPYSAMEQMVRAAALNQFDKPAVRALVQAAGLFPVGSYVQLSDRRTARVIAANPNHLDRPIVRAVAGAATADAAPGPAVDADDASARTIDLSTMPTRTLAVVKPVPAPAEPDPAPAAA